MRTLLLAVCSLFFITESIAQTNFEQDSLKIRSIFDMALLDGKSYEWLDHLSNEIGGRLSGSLEAERAVKYTENELKELGLDRVWLQPVMVPKWTRGLPEYSYIETAPGITSIADICALGGLSPHPMEALKLK